MHTKKTSFHSYEKLLAMKTLFKIVCPGRYPSFFEVMFGDTPRLKQCVAEIPPTTCQMVVWGTPVGEESR